MNARWTEFWNKLKHIVSAIQELVRDDKSKAGFGLRTVEDDERAASQVLVWSTAGCLLLALVWAGFFSLDEVTRGQGKVIPSSREQVIQSLDSGVLREMLVRVKVCSQESKVELSIADGALRAAGVDETSQAEAEIVVPVRGFARPTKSTCLCWHWPPACVPSPPTAR